MMSSGKDSRTAADELKADIELFHYRGVSKRIDVCKARLKALALRGITLVRDRSPESI